MKFRVGFVSNSSSSSFLILLKTLPTSIEELDIALFGKNYICNDSKISQIEGEYIHTQYLIQLLIDMTKGENKLFRNADVETKKNIFVETIQNHSRFLKDFQDFDTLLKMLELDKVKEYVINIDKFKQKIDKIIAVNDEYYDIFDILYPFLKNDSSKSIRNKFYEILNEHMFKNCFNDFHFKIEDYTNMFMVTYGNEVEAMRQQEYMRSFMYETFIPRSTSHYIVCESNNS